MTDVIIGTGLSLSIAYLDQKGNPMLVAPTPDAPPVWSNANPAIETLTPAEDGMTCDASAIAVGDDTVSLAVTVGGAAFAATLAVHVQEEPQVLTSVAIVAVAK